MTAVPGVSTERLRAFTSFRNLSEEDLLIFSGRIQVKEAKRGDVLFACGAIDSQEIFLLNGRLQLVAEDGRERVVEAGTPAANLPVAKLRPRQYTGKALTNLEFISVDCDVLESLFEPHNDAENMEIGYGVVEMGVEDDDSNEMLHAFKRDLEARKFRLTTLPEVALKIRALLDNQDAGARQIAELVNRDPAIAAKVVRAANSPIYFGAAKCETVQNAIVRLGLMTTKQLVIGFTLRDLFQSEVPLLRRLMTESWQESMDVAAISFVLARHTKLFDPEEAMLAGLVSNIGVLSVLNYAQNYPQLLDNEALLQQWAAKLKGEVGALVLENWQFPEEIVEVARGCEEWSRCPTTRADLCDLVLVATLHGYIGKRKFPAPPRMDQVPAYQKLALGKLTPELTLQILVEAKDQIEQARSLLTV
ncbi:MAG TPA: HDOD domain-containing protein [Spongiibacteraceae bacterium]|nr:HDOD domain-containing protein [Spongiibacteraceae bacterium]